MEINDTLLLLKLTQAEINAITGLSAGTLVYNTTLNALVIYNGTGWDIAGGTGNILYPTNSMVQLTVFDIYNTTSTDITLNTLQNIVIPANSNKDVFLPANGGLTMPQVMYNQELEGYFRTNSLYALEQNGLVIQSLVTLFGQPNIYASDRITQQGNNYGSTFLASWKNTRYFALEPDSGNQFISGFAATWHGDRKIIRNSSNTYELSFLNNNSNSIASNRILCPENNTFKIREGATAEIMYDINVARWIVLSDEKP